MMPEERNSLVQFKLDPKMPDFCGPGIEIYLDKKTPEYRIGEPIILRGRFKADVQLIIQCQGRLVSSILLTLNCADKNFTKTTPLIIPTVEIPKPVIKKRELSDDYIESGDFCFDVARFFELNGPGSYAIQASLGPYASKILSFQIIKIRF